MKKLEKLFNLVKPPKLTAGHLQLRGAFASIDGSAEREAREHNQAEIALANYEVTKEALQKNLNLTYGALIMSIMSFPLQQLH